MIERIKQFAAWLGLIEPEERKLWWVVFRNKDTHEVTWIFSIGYGTTEIAEHRYARADLENIRPRGLRENEDASIEAIPLEKALAWMDEDAPLD